MANGESSYNENLLEVAMFRLQPILLVSYYFNYTLVTNKVVSSIDHKMGKIGTKKCYSYIVGTFHRNKDGQKMYCKEIRELSVQDL